MSRPDPHSHWEPNQPRVVQLHWRAEVAFDERRINAEALLTLAEPVAGGPLDLDTRDLEIATVVDQAGAPVALELGKSHPILGSRLRLELPAGTRSLRVAYRTSPAASALQWLTPEQTAGKHQPFLYSQCQPIHARSIVPLQDTPRMRIRFEAELDVPIALRGLMAAGFLARTEKSGRAVESWKMPQPIPPYLFALAVGNLQEKLIGARSAVWAEPETVAAAAWEFADIDRLIAAGERLFGPYEWDRFDLLVMPPAFPYGGMENPRLAFLTPTLLAGDRSQVAVVAHELAHSWTGNLITNASAEDFWLNEGWTRYAEQRILEEVYGVELSNLHIALGWRALERAITRFCAQGRPELTRLKTSLAGIHPDDAFSEVPYEKGLLFLRAIELSVGRRRFDPFIRRYIDTFRFGSLTTEEFLAFTEKELPGALAAVGSRNWVEAAGIPDGAPAVQSERLAQIERLGNALPDEALGRGFRPVEWQVYLESVKSPDRAWCEAIDRRYQLNDSSNSEVLCSWLVVALAADYAPAVERTARLLGETGRMKFLKPLYGALSAQPARRQQARELFARYRDTYHPIAATVLGSML
jgi:aminopeptidase N